jgi:hypothetical protein
MNELISRYRYVYYQDTESPESYSMRHIVVVSGTCIPSAMLFFSPLTPQISKFCLIIKFSIIIFENLLVALYFLYIELL